MRHRFTAGLLAATFAAGLFAIGAPRVDASSKGRKNTVLGLGALAAYELFSGKTGNGLLAAAGAAYAYNRYNSARKNERRYRVSSYSPSYSQYQNGYSAPYTTDTSGCRHYYDPRYGDGYQQYGYQPYGYHRGGYYRTAAYQGESYPSGWRHGEKRGWRGHSVPPGHWRHGER